jgi:hypothetical protein
MTNRRFWPENRRLLYAAFAFSQGIGLLACWTLPILAGSLITGLKGTSDLGGERGSRRITGD